MNPVFSTALDFVGATWSWLANGSQNVIIALLAGAGGSALLEVFWRPRRERRRAAALLLTEIAQNTELLILQSHARLQNMWSIPADLRASVFVWDAASDKLGELPLAVMRDVAALYAQYHSLNSNVVLFGEALDRYNAATPGSKASQSLETDLLNTITVINTGIDKMIDRGQPLIPRLMKLAKVTEAEKEQAPPDFAARAQKQLTSRDEGVTMLRQIRANQIAANARKDGE